MARINNRRLISHELHEAGSGRELYYELVKKSWRARRSGVRTERSYRNVHVVHEDSEHRPIPDPARAVDLFTSSTQSAPHSSPARTLPSPASARAGRASGA